MQVCNVLFKQKKLVFGLLFICLCLFLVLLPRNHEVLVIEEAKTGNILWAHEISRDEWFHHQYIHSVEKSLVIEKFKLGYSGTIFAMESWTRSFGAGLPYELKGDLEMKDGFYILKNIYDPIDVLHMQPSHLQMHTFHFRETEIVLSEPPFSRTHIKFYVKNMSWPEFMLVKRKKGAV
ncbi:DUF1850 domain-containing protein [Anaerobacillus alkaliphilus]|uniref:DUF1850 domain-containing protein n=1 Tax=Anaerobacillus alkaliphilus TaxID=1548597 RepID=UPI001375BFAA|nr:DUF1850 domain-containing protein [Anaerobacillus alkaliphilus]